MNIGAVARNRVSGGEKARVDGACWFAGLFASDESGNESWQVMNRA